MNNERKTWNISSIIIGFFIIIAALILSNAYKYKFRSLETVTVTGMAQVDFTSDLIVWEGRYSRKETELRSAYTSLKQDEQSIRLYFKRKGIPDSSIIFSAVDLQKEYSNSFDNQGNMIRSSFAGYNLSQNVKIESRDIEKVEMLSRQVTELIEQGIEFNSIPPSYYYTKLADLKMNLLSKASADARQRAETIATSVNSKLDNLKKASMGVFQITGRNSNEEYSFGGIYNTAEKHKTASITIRMDYTLR